jgi:hypothetical protein
MTYPYYMMMRATSAIIMSSVRLNGLHLLKIKLFILIHHQALQFKAMRSELILLTESTLHLNIPLQFMFKQLP